MEVIIQEVKTEPLVPDLEEPNHHHHPYEHHHLQLQRGAFSVSPPGREESHGNIQEGYGHNHNHHNSSNSTGFSHNGSNSNHVNQDSSSRTIVSSSSTSSHHPNSVVAHNHNGTTASIVSNSTPVRTTSSSSLFSGQRLQTMAKSSGLSIVHVTLPQTVIQSPSVIQSAAGQLQLSKGNVILVSSKANSSVIQTTSGAIQTVQVLDHPHSDDSLSNDGAGGPDHHQDNVGRSSDRKRREILTRRPSYRKILSDLGGAEISGEKVESPSSSESSQDAEGSGLILGGSQYPPGVVKVINANALGLGQVTTAGDATSVPAASLQTITMTNAGTAGGTIVQYAQSQDGQQFFVPVGSELQAYTIRPVSSASSSPSVVVTGGGHHIPEEATRKREIRLLKNREAARECRRKKKEYIKCLENRVAVLENQNKALIDELKSLKELYCQQKTE